MTQNPACRGSDEVDLLVDRYLRDCDGNPLAALRSALSDALHDAIEARLRIMELERAASTGDLRGSPVRPESGGGDAKALG